MNRYRCIVGCCILFELIVASCVPAANTAAVPTFSAIPYASLATKLNPTSSQITSATGSPTPTAPFYLITPNATNTHAPPIWTPLPTLVATEAQAFAMDLLVNNAGCQLPCWWGFIPGKTSWNEAQQFLGQFAKEISGGAGLDDPSMLYEAALIPVPKSYDPFGLETFYTIKNGIIQTMEIYFGKGVSTYRLSSFLSTYGEPTEIKILTFQNENPPGFLPFVIFLFYPDKGIYAIFGPEESEVIDNVVRGCKLDNPASMLGLWAPEQTMTFDEASKVFRTYPEHEHFLSLEMAANMDVNTFYETFKKPDSPVCIETPAKLWTER